MSDQPQLEAFVRAALGQERCPSPEQLAAYIADALPGIDYLHIAAHLRLCPLCTHDIALATNTASDIEQRWFLHVDKVSKPRLAIARPFERRAIGQLRAGEEHAANLRHYIAADIAINLTIAPPVAERWRISGFVTQADTPLVERRVTLRERRRRFAQQTSMEGFFTFEKVPAGHYTLSVVEGSVVIQIRDLHLALPS